MNPGALRGLPQLTTIAWRNGDFDDRWLVELAQQNLPLEALELVECNEVTGTGIGALRTLQSMWIEQSEAFSDFGLVEICNLPLLEHLVLDHCGGYGYGLTSKGFRALRRATRLSKLCFLCHHVSVWRLRVWCFRE